MKDDPGVEEAFFGAKVNDSEKVMNHIKMSRGGVDAATHGHLQKHQQHRLHQVVPGWTTWLHVCSNKIRLV